MGFNSAFKGLNKNYFDVQIKTADWIVHVTCQTEKRGYKFKILGDKPLLRKVK
jgi:hypothetical protein